VFGRQADQDRQFIRAFCPYTAGPSLASNLGMQSLLSLEVVLVRFCKCLYSNVYSGSEYRDRLELKSTNDRTLGLGVSPTSNFLLILTATSMMKVSLDLEKIDAFKPEYAMFDILQMLSSY
jgi:hypothetical protein